MRKIYFVIAASMLMSMALAIHQWGPTKKESNLLWENIEALANPEGERENLDCLFTGDVKCPQTGDMVRDVIRSYSLKKRYELK